jgi:uncharacterized membrane protein
MYPLLLSLHNLLRWVVVIAGVLAIVRALIALSGKRPWAMLDDRLSLIFTISLDVQVLLGLLLYVVFSPLTTAAFANFGAAMADSEMRFWLVEHISVMVVALVLAHIGRSRAKKAVGDTAKYKQIAIFFTLALLAVLLAIPWARPLIRF